MYILPGLQQGFMISHQLFIFCFRFSHAQVVVHFCTESRFHEKSCELGRVIGDMTRDWGR